MAGSTNKAAYSLVELIVAVALIGLVALALGSMILMLVRSHRYAFEQGSAIQEGRRALERIADLIRTATYGEDGSYALASVATSSLTLYADADYDGVVERVRFWLSGTTFYEGISEPQGTPPTYGSEVVRVLATYVRNGEDAIPVFQAFDAQGEQLPLPAPVLSVRTIHIRFIVNVARNRKPGDFTIATTAGLRNTRLAQ